MVIIKTSEQLSLMKRAGEITGGALAAAHAAIREGISTAELDRIVRSYIESHDAVPSFLGYGGFPGSACISINDQVIHGIPSRKVIVRDGDIVKIDVGACYRGYHGDSARTFAVGNVSPETLRLIEITEQSFRAGADCARSGLRIGDIGSAVSAVAESAGYGVVRDYVGHGVGSHLHEEPEVPNFGRAGHGPRLYPGMTIAIEPMINAGTHKVVVLGDGWTVVTADHSMSAHYEHTVLVTSDGPVLLTDVGD